MSCRSGAWSALAAIMALGLLAACQVRNAPPEAAPSLATPAAALELQRADGPDASAGRDAIEPNAAASPAPSQTPRPEARLTRLTEPGCCTQAQWGADGQSLYFIDQPDPSAPLGLYSLDIEAPGTQPRLLEEQVAFYSQGMRFRFEEEAGMTVLERRSDGSRYAVPAGGRPVLVSPDERHVAWQVSPPGVPYERRISEIWVAPLEGGEARALVSLPRGSLAGWLDAETLLLRGRDQLAAEEDVVWALSIDGEQRRELARAKRLRGALASPGGRWLAYYVSRQADPDDNGIWIVPSAGGPAERLESLPFGAYRWRDASRLILVPQEPGAGSHRLLELDLETGQVRALTDPDRTAFTIANGDWRVSPDGRHVSLVESRDKALWLLTLP